MANTVLITELYRSYLAEFLLSKGYEVHGTRSASTFNTARIDHIYSDSHDSPAKRFLHNGDFSDTSSQLTNSTFSTPAQEVYHLPAQSHARVSFGSQGKTGDVPGWRIVRILQTIKRNGLSDKFNQTSSSEIFGNASPPQSEDTTFYSRSP